MWKIIREVFNHLIFLLFIYVIVYSYVQPNAFYQMKHLQNFFSNVNSADNDYTQVRINLRNKFIILFNYRFQQLINIGNG